MMSGGSEPVGTLDVALAHADRLLASDPALAAGQAGEILKVVPNHPVAMLILGSARRIMGDAASAIAVLGPLVEAQPHSAAAHFEHGRALALAGNGDAAIAALRRAVSLKPDLADAWRILADHLHAIGDVAGADDAYANHIRAATRDPRLLAPAAALCKGRIPIAETLLRAHLKKYPTDVAAIRMLAEVAARLGRFTDAENLLVRCLELAPGFTAARQNYATVLHRQNKPTEALTQIDELLAKEPRSPGLRTLKAAVLVTVGEYTRAIELLGGVLAEYPQQAKVWLSYGHTLKTAGRLPEGIDAYRKSIELMPRLGEAYWSLANLKTFRFTPAEVESMRREAERPELTPEDRFHFHFALGKALEDAADYAGSFEHYAEGNRLRREGIKYRAEETTEQVDECQRLFTREFFDARPGVGAPSRDPIFIVGLPRSGSTLIEQILSSHSAVEGTMELPDIVTMVRRLGGRRTRTERSKYPGVLATLAPDELRELGERYLEQTRIQRKTSAPYFIDKLPNNWIHVGFIHLILPNAKIVDARRHPMSSGFSGFKQHFARGQLFTFSLEDIGRYYRDYVRLMAHYDEVLPGRVHRVIYEAMVEDTETEIRRLLDYCGLPFEEGCLRFYDNERAVRTPSAEQVRSPIYREGLEQWRNYARWLGPLEETLGPLVAAYPAVPKI